MLKGASLAFITSVVGITLSICFSWVEKRKIKNVKKSLNSFVDSLEKSLSFITSEQIHLQIRDAAKEQNKKLDGFSNELAIALGNVVSTPLKETDEIMAKNFKHFEKFTNQFHALLSKYVSDLTK